MKNKTTREGAGSSTTLMKNDNKNAACDSGTATCCNDVLKTSEKLECQVRAVNCAMHKAL